MNNLSIESQRKDRADAWNRLLIGMRIWEGFTESTDFLAREYYCLFVGMALMEQENRKITQQTVEDLLRGVSAATKKRRIGEALKGDANGPLILMELAESDDKSEGGSKEAENKSEAENRDADNKVECEGRLESEEKQEIDTETNNQAKAAKYYRLAPRMREHCELLADFEADKIDATDPRILRILAR